MKLKVLNCNKIENGFKIDIEYIEGEQLYVDGKGGQIGDLGTVGPANILKVQEGSLLVDKELFPQEYQYTIDSIRREDASSNHSGEHLFSALAFLKYKWRTVGFRMSEKYCTLDFDTDKITEDMVIALENDVNEKIKEGHNVCENIYDSETAQTIMKDRKDIPDKIKGNVRIVSTFPEDFNACAGIHVNNTKDIRMFKILSYEKIKGSYTRFYFISGERVFKDYSLKHNICSQLGVTFSCQPDEIISMIDKSLDEKKRIEKEIKNLSIKYAELLAEKIIKTPDNIIQINDNESIDLFFVNEDKLINESIKKIFQNLNNKNFLLITYNSNNYSLISSNIDLQPIFKFLKDKFNLKGGGNIKNINFNSELAPNIFINEIKILLTK